jgi:hypothetical protein
MNMRPFGTRMDDLEVDFDLVRPVAITEVLARCAGVECELLWDLPVGRRTELLLALAELSGKVDYEAGMNCPECGLEVEVVLTLDEFRSAVAPHREDAVIVGQSRYRLPTGRDQLEWLRQANDDEAALAARIIESLCVEGNAPAEAVEAALDAADPLMRTAVTAVCVQCGHSADLEMDVAEQALRSLETEQRALLAGVHILASRYHWSEAEIFALPAWRRNRYLELIGDNMERR